MARTVNSSPRGKGTHWAVKKAPRSGRKGGIKPQRKVNPSLSALKEIRTQQRSTKACIPYAPFKRVVKEILTNADLGGNKRISDQAVHALHEVSEIMLVGVLADANICALHAGRVTVTDRDIRLVKTLRSDESGGQHGGRAGDIVGLQ